MKILVINTNGNAADTLAIGATARRYAQSGTEIEAVNPEPAPGWLGGYGTIAWATYAVVSLLRERGQDIDAAVLACFEDPGLYAARETVSLPVFGIAESAMLMACTIGHRFSIVTTPSTFQPITANQVRLYGLEQRCASVRAIDLADDDDPAMHAALEEAGRRCLQDDGAEVLILGCSKLSRFDKALEAALNVPVLDGVACAVKMAEACVGYGLRTSKWKGFATSP